MAVFTVLEPMPSGDAHRDAARVVLVREGFHWLAFLAPLLWMLWYRMWLVLIGWLVAAAVLEAVAAQVGGPAPALTGIGLSLWFGFEAGALRRWTLTRRGYRFTALVAGANRAACEQRLFESWAAGRAAPPAAPMSPLSQRPTSSGVPNTSAVIGLFPTPERPA